MNGKYIFITLNKVQWQELAMFNNNQSNSNNHIIPFNAWFNTIYWKFTLSKQRHHLLAPKTNYTCNKLQPKRCSGRIKVNPRLWFNLESLNFKDFISYRETKPIVNIKSRLRSSFYCFTKILVLPGTNIFLKFIILLQGLTSVQSL